MKFFKKVKVFYKNRCWVDKKQYYYETTAQYIVSYQVYKFFNKKKSFVDAMC